jgi:hypothetical protein
MGDILEVKSFLRKLFPVGFSYFFPVGNEVFQYLPVFPEDGIYIADKAGVTAVALIIICIAAPVVAEFFINPAFNRLATIQAISLLRGVWHKFQLYN